MRTNNGPIRRTLGKDLKLLLLGATIPVLVIVFLLRFGALSMRPNEPESRQQAVELIDRIRFAAAEVSDAELSAVLSQSETQTSRLASQASEALSQAARDSAVLASLVDKLETPKGMERIEKLNTGLAALRRANDQIMRLARENSNAKAYELAYGKETELARRIDDTLRSTSSSPQLRSNANDIGRRIWRMLALLPAHIAERDDVRMGAIENEVQENETAVDIEFGRSPQTPSIERARTLWNQFTETELQIIKLSRANTNLKSIDLALSIRTNAVLAVQETLLALRESTLQSPVGMPPSNPR